MPKYIDVEKLDLTPDEHGGMNGVLIVSGGRSGGKTAAMVQRVLKQMIDNAPAEDVVKVTRCGACQHWNHNENNLFGPEYGTCVECLMDTKEEFYCGYGKPKVI